MAGDTIHNPDRFMVDLRQILSQGRKRVGLLVGAGAPCAVRVDANNVIDPGGSPLIPDIARLTENVLNALAQEDREKIALITADLGANSNIEAILTKARRLSQAIGSAPVYQWTGPDYGALAERICGEIGKIVASKLPDEPNSFSELVAWIGGTNRIHPVEIFTPNYDLLFEEAFERARLPYFDGFSGSHRPFFDPTSVADDHLPSRWSRIWKIHGSLGWEVQGDTIVRTGNRDATSLIYPDHLKYDQIARQPYSALFERLRVFLSAPDTLLLCTGFSFFDQHITSVIDEGLAANPHSAVLAFQFKTLEEEGQAVEYGHRRPNLSVYARDRAVISGVEGKWQPGQPPSEEWRNIRNTFWSQESGGQFLLGDFAKLSRFCALAQASAMQPEPAVLDAPIDEPAAIEIGLAEAASEVPPGA